MAEVGRHEGQDAKVGGGIDDECTDDIPDRARRLCEVAERSYYFAKTDREHEDILLWEVASVTHVELPDWYVAIESLPAPPGGNSPPRILPRTDSAHRTRQLRRPAARARLPMPTTCSRVLIRSDRLYSLPPRSRLLPRRSDPSPNRSLTSSATASRLICLRLSSSSNRSP